MEVIGFLSVLTTFLIVISTIISFICSQSKSDFRRFLGLKIDAKLFKETAYGVLMGLVLVTGIFLSFMLFSVISEFKVMSPISYVHLVREATSTFFFALIEELIFRSIILGGLYYFSSRKWLALFVSSFLFGFAHAGNPDASMISISSNFMGGLMYGLAFWGTGRIWLPLGLHFAWNYVQGPVLGFNVSGITSKGLFYLDIQGSAVITGGCYGPEASVVGIGFRLICIMVLVLWFKQSLFQK